MKRGDIVIISLRGLVGKPRPAVVIQSDRLVQRTTVLVCPLTTETEEAITLRPMIEATAGTGLRARSQIMVERISVVERARCGAPIGELDETSLASLDESLAFVIGLADDPA